jgi:NAD(P)-dependent dehydrogenase (short-subunit alcohol dehydrogenase family)
VSGCRALADQLSTRESKLDILVNNAGAAWGAPFDEFPEHGWDKVMNVNVKTPFFLTQLLHGALKAAASDERPAKVINIASIDGIRLNPLETYSYHASKSALIYLTRRMAATLVEDRIVGYRSAQGEVTITRPACVAVRCRSSLQSAYGSPRGSTAPSSAGRYSPSDRRPPVSRRAIGSSQDARPARPA